MYGDVRQFNSLARQPCLYVTCY